MSTHHHQSIAATIMSVGIHPITAGHYHIPAGRRIAQEVYTVELADKLEKHSEPEPTSGCWIWFGCSLPAGYGKVRSGDGKTLMAHRASWMVHKGDIPDGLCVLHKCDTPACINPDHLFLGTYRDNARDRQAKGRGVHYSGEKHGRAKLSESDVTDIRRLCDLGVRHKDIASEFGVSKSLIHAIHSRRVWKHVAV